MPNVHGFNIWVYDEASSVLVEKFLAKTNWHLIELSSGFDVLDVVLVDSCDSPTIYGIQITRAKDHFEKHHTLDTFSTRSKHRLNNLWLVINETLKINDPKIVFTMIAPNCEKDKFNPRAGHTKPYYFSPENVVFDYLPMEKRLSSYPTTSRAKRSRRQK